MVVRAGLSWKEALVYLGNPDSEAVWEDITTKNRDHIYGKGLWGVPCIEFGEVLVWGQDRIWVIEEAIAASFEK